MKLKDFLKVLKEAYGTKTYIRIYLNYENGRLSAEPKQIWYGLLNNLKKKYDNFECKNGANLEVTWISNSSTGLATTMTIFVKEIVNERKEAA